MALSNAWEKEFLPLAKLVGYDKAAEFWHSRPRYSQKGDVALMAQLASEGQYSEIFTSCLEKLGFERKLAGAQKREGNGPAAKAPRTAAAVPTCSHCKRGRHLL